MNNIKLYRNYWSERFTESATFHVCGWAQHKDAVLNKEGLLDVVIAMNYSDQELFQKFIIELNGNFSIIIVTPSQTIIAVDKMRTYPVLYYNNGTEIIVTDDILRYRKEKRLQLEIDERIVEQYICSGYIFGSYSIFKDVFSVQSGEIVCINNLNKSFSRIQYFQWKPNMNNDYQRSLEKEAEEQDNILTNVFTRMIKSAPKVNNWVVPLSGGYDSRTIVNYLYKLGVRNVLCYSYGLKNNIEAKISQQVAETLGYKWYFIDNPLDWIIRIKKTNQLTEYLDYGFNGTSVPTIGDFPTVFALKEMGVIQKNDVFVPGHALEVLAGNHLDVLMQKCDNIESVINIVKRHFALFGYFTGKRDNIVNITLNILNNYKLDFSEMAERFDWQERQTKFIANSVKSYEFFGFDWRIPEWDNELFEYWHKIGFNSRLNRKMYKELFKKTLLVDILKPIPFSNDLLATSRKSIKSVIRDYVPLSIKKTVRNLGYNKKTDKYLNLEAQLLIPDLKENLLSYTRSFNVPESIKKYINSYPQKQAISTLGTLEIISLLNLRYAASKIV